MPGSSDFQVVDQAGIAQLGGGHRYQRNIGLHVFAGGRLEVGLAAQRSITNMLVGLQIALTQPIRLDDVVIVEGEWGRIEEITTTYVVVKLWDLRRLIVPSTYFTENKRPFHNAGNKLVRGLINFLFK